MLVLVAVDDPTTAVVGRPMLRAGRWAEGPGEVVLDAGFARREHIALGDRAEVEWLGEGVMLEVVGTSTDVLGCFSPCLPARAFVTGAGLDHLAPRGGHGTLVALQALPGRADVVVGQLRAAGVEGVVAWSTVRGAALQPGRLFAAFLAGFGAVVLLATTIVVANTAIGSVILRRRETATLQAIGVGPRFLAAATVGEHVVTGSVGVVLGWLIGSALAPWLHIGLTDALGHAKPTLVPGRLLLAWAGVAAALVVSSLAPALRASRTSIGEAMADAPGTARHLRALVARVGGPVPVQLGVQVALARPVRTLLAALALATALAASLGAWQVSAAADQVMRDRSLTGDTSDIYLNRPWEMPVAEVDETLAPVPDVAGWYREAEFDGVIGATPLRVRAFSDVDAVGLHRVEGRLPAAPGEASAGWGLLSSLGAEIGDTVRVSLGDRTVEVAIVGRHSDLREYGRVLATPLSSLADGTGLAPVGVWRVRVAAHADPAVVAARIEAAFAGRAVVQPRTGDVADRIAPFRWVLAVLALLVVAVAVGNLVATLAANSRERRRQTGVIRSLGFGPRELAWRAISSGMAVGVPAVVAGIPAGVFVGRVVLTSAATELGLGPGVLAPGHLGPAAVGAVVVLAISAGAGVLANRRIDQMPAAALVREI